MSGGMGSVLYVTYDGLLEPLGGSQVLPYVLGLAEEGFAMEVLSFEKPSDLADTTRLRGLEERLEEAGVVWARYRYHRRPSLPATALDLIRGSRRAAGRAREIPGMLVHARGYVPALMGLRAKRAADAVLLFDMRGFWIDERIEAGRWKAGSATVGMARRAERALLRESDFLVHLTEKAAQTVGQLTPGTELPPSRVVTTCVDLERFTICPDPALARAELGLGEGPVLVHAGTLSGWYLGELTFRVAAEFVEQTGGSFLVLTREGELARRLAREHGVEPVVAEVAHEEVPRWLAAGDAGLALVRPSFSKGASAPTKIGEYLAVGMVTVSTEGIGDLDRHFEGVSSALTVDPREDPREIARKIVEALRRPDRRESARNLARRAYDVRRAVEAYAEIYASMGARRCE